MIKNNYKLDIRKYSTHSVIAKEIGKGKRVLDVGCNTGYLGKISDPSCTFFGIDYFADTLKEAKGFYRDVAKYDLNKVKKLPWNHKYDVIVMADVLEHIIEPNNVLHFFINNYLEKNGILIISLPNIANYKIRIDLLRGLFDYTDSGILDKTHLKLYTYKSALKLTHDNSLKAYKILYGASILGHIINIFPFTRNLLATGIILVCKK